MNHYVYRLDDPITNEFYIGSRSCNCNIDDDTYMGSYKTWKPIDSTRLIKTILKTDFNSREIATEYESDLIKENINHELNRNYSLPNGNFHQIGRTFTDEHRDNLRIAHLGNTHTQSTRDKISKSQYKEVYQLDINMNIIDKFSSIKEASEKTGFCAQSISACSKRKLISHPYKQYYWCLPVDYNTFNEWIKIQNITRGVVARKVILETDDGELHEFESIKNASIYYGISYSKIHRNINNITKVHKLGQWRYK